MRFICIFLLLYGYACAGLKEEINNSFSWCKRSAGNYTITYCETEKYDETYLELLENDEKDCYGRKIHTTPEEECFNEFWSKYGNILERQCKNHNKRDECFMFFESMLYNNKAFLTYEGNKWILDKIHDFCNPQECYEIAEKLDLDSNVAKPFLTKACEGGIEDACYVLGK